MPESLVISTRQNVLDAVDHLRVAEGFNISVEGDFTRGLKAIFYGLPEVVFIQDEIGGISGEKVAGQVKTLLDEEPIRLVLLREMSGDWNAGDLGFEAVIDTGLPFDDLVDRFRQEISALSGSKGLPTASPLTGPAPDESPPASSPHDNSLEFDPFSDIFPAHYHQNWGGIPPESGDEPPVDGILFQAPVEPPSSFNEFSFDPPGDIVTSIPLEKPATPELIREGREYGGPATPGTAAADADSGKFLYGKEFRLTDKESPHQLFASISEEEKEREIHPHGRENGTPTSTVERLRLKGVQMQSSLLKDESFDIPESLPPPGPSVSSSVPGSASSSRHSSRPQPMNSTQKSPTAAGSRGRSSLRDNETLTGGFVERRSLVRMAVAAFLLILISLATFLLVWYWDDLSNFLFRDKETVSTPETSPVGQKRPVLTDLPEFFPKVPQDSAYPAAHPGWERYEDGGLGYLVFRENGRIGAIQVIAGADGKISDSFLMTCIRDTMGLDNGIDWVREQRDGFQIEMGVLKDRGEVAVYRKMPEGEIRGFVLTFN